MVQKKLRSKRKKIVKVYPFYKTSYSRMPKEIIDLRDIDSKLHKISMTSLRGFYYIVSPEGENLINSLEDYNNSLDNLYELIGDVSRWDLRSKFLLDILQLNHTLCYVTVAKTNEYNSVNITADYLSSMLRFYYKTSTDKKRIHSEQLEDTCFYLAKHLHRMVNRSTLGLKYYRTKSVYSIANKEDKLQKRDNVQPSFNYLMDLFDMLEYNCMGHTYLGFKFKDNSAEISLFIPQGDLLTHLLSVTKNYRPTKEVFHESRSTVIVRDEFKNIVSTDQFENLKEFIEVNEKIVTALNDKIKRHTIEIEGIVLDGISFSRIFVESTVDLGGRLFDRGEWTTLPKEKRKLLKIDNEDTLTADLKAIHPSLLYREEGIKLPEDFDPYPALDIEIDEKDIKKYCKYYKISKYNPVRSIAKVALLIMINSKSRHDAESALRYKMVKDYQKAGTSKEDSMDFIGVSIADVSKILDQIEEHNKPISHHFYTQASKRLMRIDSDIIVRTAELLLTEDVVMLPLHDSITVAESKIHLAIEKFRQAYVDVVGDAINFRVEIE